MVNAVVVQKVNEVSPEIAEAVQRLIPQISSYCSAPSHKELEELVLSESSCLFIAREQNKRRIIGVLTLVIFRITTGKRARIEDVVVDESSRRQGVGRLLSEAALEEARKSRVKTVDLTSSASREAAHRLYKSLGFKERETNSYRIVLDG